MAETTINDHLVGTNGASVTMLMPPVMPMSKDEAIRLAAWLVLCAGDYDANRFAEIFKAVCST